MLRMAADRRRVELVAPSRAPRVYWQNKSPRACGNMLAMKVLATADCKLPRVAIARATLSAHCHLLSSHSIITSTRMKVLITGGTRGIGRRTVEALSNNGEHSIFLGCRDMRVGLDIATQLGAAVTPVELDVTSIKSVGAAAQLMADSGVQIDALINNAGVLLEPMASTWPPLSNRRWSTLMGSSR